MMKHVGSTVKNSISYYYIKDERDDKDCPSQGYLFNCYSVYIILLYIILFIYLFLYIGISWIWWTL